MRVTPRKTAFAGCTTLAVWAFLSGHLGLPGHKTSQAGQQLTPQEKTGTDAPQDTLTLSAHQRSQKDESLLRRPFSTPGMDTQSTALEVIRSIR